MTTVHPTRPWALINVAYLAAGLTLGAFRAAAVIVLRFVWWPFVAAPATLPDGVTPALLTRTLRARGLLSSDVTVTAVRREELSADLAQGNIAHPVRLVLSYSDAAKAAASGAPATAVMKSSGTTPGTAMINAMWSLAAREFTAYSSLAEHCPALRPLLPAVYHVAYDSVLGLFCVVLEDLSGLRQVGSTTGGSVEDVTAIVSSLAALHTATWNRREVLALFRWGRRGRALDAMYPGIIDRLQKDPRFSLGPRTVRTLDALRYLAPFDTLCALIKGYRLTEDNRGRHGAACVVCHGDARLDNCFFTAKGAARLVDWQVPMAQHPAMDLVWLLMELPSAALREGTAITTVLAEYGRHLSPEQVEQADLEVTIPAAVALTTTYWATAALGVSVRSELAQLYWDRLEVLLGVFPSGIATAQGGAAVASN